MKRNKLSMLGAGFAMALAGLMGTAPVAQASVPSTQGTQDTKATAPRTHDRESRKIHSVGGLDLLQMGEYGMSPKEYGMMYGHGNKGRRTNMNRLSHNAKLKRRS